MTSADSQSRQWLGIYHDLWATQMSDKEKVRQLYANVL